MNTDVTHDETYAEAVVSSTETNGPVHRATRRGWRSLGRGLLFSALALWEVLLLCWVLVCVSLTVIGIGLVLLPPALAAVRRDARRQRRLARELSGLPVTENYLPDPPPTSGWLAGMRREVARAADPSTWKDLFWHLVNPVVGLAIGIVPAALLAHGIFGMLMPLLWGPVVSGWENSWYGFLPLNSPSDAALACAFGVVNVVLAVVIAPGFVRLHGRWVGAVLSTQSRDQLQARVEHLARSRSDAVTHEANEIRRIERDLHDGAQARLVAMGMTLNTAERLIDDNPEAARAMLQEAKASSSAVLTELRELVRGIHPPVLADRGLVDALRARGLQAPLPVTVESDLPGRPMPAIESAVYFAVSELLANVAKHAGASRVALAVTHRDGLLRVKVVDDGRGGASLESPGSGLRGIEQRLAAFDGDLLVHSPAGGPSTMTVLVPCVLTPTASGHDPLA